MIQVIAPLQYFPVSRVLPDPTDVTVYYVMAVVRNASTGVTLASVKLLSQGNQIYAATYRAPALASSQGLFISITTTVYTDNAYSVLSQLYGNDQDTFQVFDNTTLATIQAQQIAAIVAGSIPDTSPADVNYKKIEKIVLAALAGALPGLSQAVEKLHDKVGALDFKTDLTPVLKAIDAKNPDLSPVLEALGRIDFQPLHDRLTELAKSIPSEAPSLAPVLASIEELKAPEGQISPIEKVHSVAQQILSITTRLAQGHKDVLAAVTDVQKRQKKQPVLSMLPAEEEPERNEFGRVVKKEK